MTITLDIKPEIEAALARQAAAHGLGIEAYASTLLEEAAAVPGPSKPRSAIDAKNMVELFAPLRGMNLDFERDRDLGRDIVL